MKKRFTKKQAISLFLGATLIATQAMNAMPTRLIVNTKAKSSNKTSNATSNTTKSERKYAERFKELYDIIMDEDTGYFDENGIPYHSIEKLMVEAPDYGHESTSEAASYLVWLQAVNGRITGDYSGIDESWDVINKYFIPTEDQQPSGGYNPSSPATYADEYEVPSKYPSQLQTGSVQSGSDPLYNELKNTYHTDTVYGMHWLVDVDNFFGFGQKGNLSQDSDPVYINTFQRGKMEGCWNTIPQPSWENFSSGGQSGFLPYFTGDSTYSKQWRYTIASDADARVVQAMYRASEWAENDDDASTNVSKSSIENTKKLGDYLRYSMYDKYFMKVGAESKTAGNGKDSCQYLLSWYYAWGGDVNGMWSWKIGSSHSHFGYQNPFAAWVLSEDSTGFVPDSATAQEDWDKSYDTQLDFYQWLQSAEGGIAGGATNSWNGRYEEYPEGTSTFNGMAYQEHPVYSNPGSNQWFGMQCWSMQRIAEVYYETGNVKAKNLMDKWVDWVESQLLMESDDAYLPGTLAWEGQPDTWTGEYTGNPNLHVTVTDWGHDVGISASLANTLTYYAAKQKADGIEGYEKHVEIAQDLLDKIWVYKDSKGLGDLQTWTSDKIDLFFANYYESDDGSVVKGVYVPANYANGKMPYGDEIKPGSSFYDLRKNAFAAEVAREKANGTDTEDGSLTYCMEKLENKKEFDITYHRFWANAEAAIAYGIMDEFFGSTEEDSEEPTTETPEDVTTEEEGDITTAAPAEDDTTSEPVKPATTEDADDDTSSEPVKPATTEDADDDTSSEPVKPATTEDADDDTSSEPVKPATTEDADDDTSSEPVKPATTEDADDDTSSEPVKPATTEDADNDTSSEPVKPTTTEDADNDATTASGNNNTTQEADTTTQTPAGPPEAPVKPDVTTEEPESTENTTSDPSSTTQDPTDTPAGPPEAPVNPNVTTEDPADSTEEGNIAVKSVTLKPSSITLKVGEQATLKATINPSNATDKSYRWVSSNPTAAIVDENGTVTALKESKVIIFAVANNNKSAQCAVTIVADDQPSGSETTTEDSDSNATTENNGGKTTTENNNSNATTENNGGKTTTEDNNSNATTENNGGKTTTEYNDSNATTENNGGKATTEDNDSNATTENNGGKATTEDNDSNATTENNGGKTTTEDNDSNATTENNGGKTTTEDNDSNDATENNGNKNTTEDSNNNNDKNDTNNSNNNDNNNNQTNTGNNDANNTTQATNNTTNQAPATNTPVSGAPNYQVGTNENEPSVLILSPDVYVTNTTITSGTIINGSSLRYQITKADANKKEAMVIGLSVKSLTNVNVPNMIVINNEVYKVTSVKSKAFNSNKKIKKVTLGKNVKTIGSKAFYKCNKVKTITIKTTKLTTKTVKSNAFAKMKANITVKVPKSKKAAYKKLLVKRGISKKATIK